MAKLAMTRKILEKLIIFTVVLSKAQSVLPRYVIFEKKWWGYSEAGWLTCG